MTVFYLMIEAVPSTDNPESREFGGAYLNCWVRASTQEDALSKAREYILQEHWLPIKTEDIWEAQRQFYEDLPESLECYDEACKNGLSVIYNTWPIDETQ